MQGQGEIVVLTPLFRSVIITILFALALVFYVSSDISFGQLFTPLPLLLVAIPLAAAHLALSLMCRVLHWSSVYLSLGVPLGLIACCVGITGMAANLQDPRELEAAMSFSFMCVLYGGVFFSVRVLCRKRVTRGSNSSAPLLEGIFAVHDGLHRDGLLCHGRGSRN